MLMGEAGTTTAALRASRRSVANGHAHKRASLIRRCFTIIQRVVAVFSAMEKAAFELPDRYGTKAIE